MGSSGLVGAAWETLQKNSPRAGGVKTQTCFPGQIKQSLGPRAQSGGGCSGDASWGKMLARVPEVMCCGMCPGHGQ